MKKSIKYGFISILILAIAIVFYNAVYIPKTTYVKQKVEIGDLKQKVFGIGTLSAKTIYGVTAGVNAKVKNLFAEEGEWVQKGDLLAEFDSVDMPILLEQSKINVKKSYTELIALQKELESLKAQKNLTELTFRRYEKLKEQSFASQSEYDKAKADLSVINAQIQVTLAHIDSAKTSTILAKKSVTALEERLSRYRLYAPVDGLIILKKGAEGTTFLASQVLFEIVNPQDVWIKAFIDERISGDLVEGNDATIVLRSKANKKYKATLKRIAPQSDSITQEREVNVVFQKLPIPFYLNEQAEVEIQTKILKEVFLIPVSAIVYKENEAGVWVEMDKKAHFKKVSILAISEGKIAIEGVNKDTLLLLQTSKNKPLTEGMEIR